MRIAKEDLDRLTHICEKATKRPWLKGGPYPGVSVCVEVDPGCGGDSPELPIWEPVAGNQSGGGEDEMKPKAKVSQYKWEADNQRRQLAEYGLADEFPFGCDSIGVVANALINARQERDSLRVALTEIAYHPHCRYEQGANLYQIGEADGHRCAAINARRVIGIVDPDKAQ